MREIVLDTETTGLEPGSGHRIIEIGCLELVNHLPTERTFHVFVNPERDIPSAAVEVHGLTADFLSDKPLFASVAEGFLEFIGSAPLIIHNAPFDMGFLNAELQRLDHPGLPMSRAVDTLALARKKYPGSPNSLEALCRRFQVDTTAREKHGALIDARLLAEVYLQLIGGRQPDLVLAPASEAGAVEQVAAAPLPRRREPLKSLLSADESAAHRR